MSLNKIIKLIVFAIIFAIMSIVLSEETSMIMRFIYSVILVSAGNYFVKTVKEK